MRHGRVVEAVPAAVLLQRVGGVVAALFLWGVLFYMCVYALVVLFGGAGCNCCCCWDGEGEGERGQGGKKGPRGGMGGKKKGVDVHVFVPGAWSHRRPSRSGDQRK